MSHLTTVSGGGHVKSVLLKSVLRVGWKFALFGDALRLLKVSSFMNDYDPVGVHQAISDESRCRRCYYDVLEVEVRGGFGVHKDLISERHAVFTRIRSTHQSLTYRIDHDRLAAAHRRAQHPRRLGAHMAHRDQTFDH